MAAMEGERIAKRLARAGLCSRREAETWIRAGRVSVDGKVLDTPAVTVTETSEILVDGKPIPEAEQTRLWRYHKPAGLLTTTRDPQGRPTIFDKLPATLPRVVTVGRLDLNSEGLLLLTNDGELARRLELPATGWTRRYRVRVYGKVDPEKLLPLAKGIAVDGVKYGPIRATLDRQMASNAWLTVALTEGKNREIRRVCEHLGWTVTRLIRLSYGPFQLVDLKPGEVEEVKGRVLTAQIGGGNSEATTGTAKAKPKKAYRGKKGGKGSPDKSRKPPPPRPSPASGRGGKKADAAANSSSPAGAEQGGEAGRVRAAKKTMGGVGEGVDSSRKKVDARSKKPARKGKPHANRRR